MQALKGNRGWNSRPWRIASWSAAAALMLLPVTIQLASGDFGWDRADFILAAVVLSSGALLFDLAARKAPNLLYLLGAGLALAAAFGLFVVNGAVGLVGSEDEPSNLLFGLVLLVAVIGAVMARGRAEVLALAMGIAAALHIVISAVLLIRAGGVSDGSVVMEIVGLAIIAAMWAAAAVLFRQARR